jgi:hypothetical protein
MIVSRVPSVARPSHRAVARAVRHDASGSPAGFFLLKLNREHGYVPADEDHPGGDRAEDEVLAFRLRAKRGGRGGTRGRTSQPRPSRMRARRGPKNGDDDDDDDASDPSDASRGMDAPRGRRTSSPRECTPAERAREVGSGSGGGGGEGIVRGASRGARAGDEAGPGANPKNDDDDDDDNDARARTRRDETHGFVRAAALGRGGLKGASGRGACALRQRATRDLGESAGRHLARGKCAPSRAISWHERHESYSTCTRTCKVCTTYEYVYK